MSHIFLFDIDLTMIRTNRVGRTAMAEVFEELTGIPDGFAGVHFGGRTDTSLVREAMVRHEIAHTPYPKFVEQFRELYLPRLAQGLQERGGEVLPGVPAMLRAVTALPDIRIGVATGNFREAATIKLRYFDLAHHFTTGGFADDAEDRAEVVATAINRLGGRAPGSNIFIFGDSTHDITAAKANGAVAIGVTTGGDTAEVLHAEGADFVFPNLMDATAILARLLG